MGGGRGGPAPIARPAGADAQIAYEAARIRALPDSPQRQEAALATNSIDSIIDLQAHQGDSAGVIGSIGKLADLHTKVEAAVTEGNYQLTEGYAEAAGTRFQAAMTASGARNENWPEAGLGQVDRLTNITNAAGQIDVTSVPGPVGEGIRTIVRLQGQAEEHDIAAKHLEAYGEVRNQMKENRTIFKNGFREAGYYIMHLGPGIALGVLAGLIAGPLGAGVGMAILAGGGTFAVSELVGGITLAFNEKFHGLVDESNNARKRIEEAHKKIAQIRIGTISGNINLVAALGTLQEELWANAGFVDAAGNRMRDVTNNDRIKGAFNRTGGVPSGIKTTLTAFAGV